MQQKKRSRILFCKTHRKQWIPMYRRLQSRAGKRCYSCAYVPSYRIYRILSVSDYSGKRLGEKAVRRHRDSEEQRGNRKTVHDYAEKLIAIGRRIDAETMWNCVNLLKICNVAHIIAIGNTCSVSKYMGVPAGKAWNKEYL